MRTRQYNPLPTAHNIYDLVRYAVVMPLVKTDGAWHVLLEVRAAGLRRHPAEVALPGGRIEQTDTGSLSAGLREMREELGIDSGSWEVLGALPLAQTAYGRWVAPHVIRRDGLPTLYPDPVEVADVFTVPVNWLMQTKPEQMTMWDGVYMETDMPFPMEPRRSPGWRKVASYDVYFYRYDGHVIWGLTARILRSFLAVCNTAGIGPDYDFFKWEENNHEHSIHPH